MKTEKEISSWARALYESLENSPEKKDEIFSRSKFSLGKKWMYFSIIVKKAEVIRRREKKAKLFISHDYSNKEELMSIIKEKFPEIEEIDCEIDENLLAGFRLKTKDILVRASLKDVLLRLKNKINGHSRTI